MRPATPVTSTRTIPPPFSIGDQASTATCRHRERADQGVHMHDEFSGRFNLMGERRIRLDVAAVAPTAVRLLFLGEPVAHADQPRQVALLPRNQIEQPAAPRTFANL